MPDKSHRAIIIIGREQLADSTFAQAEQCDEVFVIARALPDTGERFVIDDERARGAARTRLRHALARLRAKGVLAYGVVGDENVTAARKDAQAAFPAADVVLA